MSTRRQPQRLPPPIMHGTEAIEAEVILRDFPEEQGLVLWKTVRSVRLWAELPDAERSRAFTAGAHDKRVAALKQATFPDEILAPLRKAAGVLQPRARAATIAAACRTISRWAGDSGSVGASIEFMQAAAVALPAEAELAWEVARLARSNADFARAETWYRQAISRARRAQNWYDFSRSYIGLGTICTVRGLYPQAKRSFIRGLRAAKRFSIRPLIGAAYHELALLAIHRRRSGDVLRYTRLALEAYGSKHPRLPSLAFDYGVFLVSSGYVADAIRIFRSVPKDSGTSLDRLMTTAATARAAGAVGDRSTYLAAWDEVQTLIRDPSVAAGAATALLSLAHGARSLGDTDRAERAALDARQLAREHGESGVGLAAAGLLESLRAGVALATGPAGTKPIPPKVRQLVEDLEAMLVADEAV